MKDCYLCGQPFIKAKKPLSDVPEEDVHEEDVMWQSDEEEISDSSTEQEFEEEDEIELALAIAGKRIARFDEEHWGQTLEYIK